LVNDSGVTWNNLETHSPYEDKLYTNLELPKDYLDRAGHIFQGYFVAPATTQYRFRMACDDYCTMDMGLNTSNPLETTQIMSRFGWTHRRYTMRLLGSDTTSAWLNLTKGEKYYFKSKHYEGGGGDNYVVGVEINNTNMTDHHHSMKEIQFVSVAVKDPKFEQTRVTVTNIDLGGTYYLSFQNPSDLQYTVSGEISVTASASSFRSKVKSYYWDNFRTDITVARTM